ncbi:MAG: hypothetical protein GY816_08875 [Cytophagales bacterium]|nr:hypothetical protein [Cytophagales bacterium]
MKSSLIFICTLLFLISCKNRDLNEGEEFRPREVHDSFQDSHFAKVTIDGVEYLMMERDNNNPHEGFGFMAYRGNRMIEKQDTTLAYVRALFEIQVRMYAETSGRDIGEIRREADSIFSSFLMEEQLEINRLEADSLRSK